MRARPDEEELTGVIAPNPGCAYGQELSRVVLIYPVSKAGRPERDITGPGH